MGCREEKLSKYLTQAFRVHCNAMICRQVTLSGDVEWPKVADAVIEATVCTSIMTHKPGSPTDSRSRCSSGMRSIPYRLVWRDGPGAGAVIYAIYGCMQTSEGRDMART